MPKFEKGSKEAIEWGKKMKAARDKKKQINGGWLQPGENVGAIVSNDAVPLEDMTDIEGGKIMGMGPGYSKPKKPKKIVPETIQVAPAKKSLPKLGNNGELPVMNTKERDAFNEIIDEFKIYDTDELRELIDRERVRADTPASRWGHPYDVGMYIALLKTLYEKGVEGGKIGIGKVAKGFSKVGKAFSTATDKINPLSYAVKDKNISNAMRKAGEFTQNYALPAVVQAGLPLYYGAAGTAGMMLGGPVGAVAATKGADILYQEMVGKKGYDPRERQKSKLLGNVAQSMGSAGASELKSEMKQPKMKGSGNRSGRVVDEPRETNEERRQREIYEMFQNMNAESANRDRIYNQYSVRVNNKLNQIMNSEVSKNKKIKLLRKLYNVVREADERDDRPDLLYLIDDAQRRVRLNEDIPVAVDMEQDPVFLQDVRVAEELNDEEQLPVADYAGRGLTKKQKQMRLIKMAREGNIRLIIK